MIIPIITKRTTPLDNPARLRIYRNNMRDTVLRRQEKDSLAVVFPEQLKKIRGMK